MIPLLLEVITMTNSEVVQAFVDGEPIGAANNLSISGDYLYSYKTPIAKRFFNGSAVYHIDVAQRFYSMTTSQHRGRIYRAAELRGVTIGKGYEEITPPKKD